MNPMHCTECEVDAVLEYTAHNMEHHRCPQCHNAFWRPVAGGRLEDGRINRRRLTPAALDPRLR